MQSDIAELHKRACAQVTTRVERIAAGQWDLPTPCTEWNVRDLVARPFVELGDIGLHRDLLSHDLAGSTSVAQLSCFQSGSGARRPAWGTNFERSTSR